MSAIAANHRVKSYPGAVRALDDLWLTVEPGEMRGDAVHLES